MRIAIRRSRAQTLRVEADQVEDQHFARIESRRRPNNSFERLEAPGDCRTHRAWGSTSFGAVAHQAIARRHRPHAAQAGRGFITAHHLELSFVLVDACEQHRLVGAQRQFVEQELRREVVAAIEKEIVTGGQPFGVAGVQTQRVRLDAHFRIQCVYAPPPAWISQAQSASAYRSGVQVRWLRGDRRRRCRAGRCPHRPGIKHRRAGPPAPTTSTDAPQARTPSDSPTRST
jgi:hypothetical protein